MANRILRDWTLSENIDLLSMGAEVFFTRLIMKADDHGRFHANPKLLKAALFPLKEVTESEIAVWLNELYEIGILTHYEVDSKKYLEIKDFGQRLRTMVSKFPEPRGQSAVICPPAVVNERPEGRKEEKPETRNQKPETEGRKEEEVPPIPDPEIFHHSEIVQFVNKTFDKDFIDRNLTRLCRDCINDLITVHDYTKEQILTAWGNIKKDQFQVDKKFNIVTFNYLAETKTIERYLFWKNEKTDTQQNKPQVFNRNSLRLD